MGGIAGIITLGGRPPKAHLDRMLARLVRRGLDDKGSLFANGIGLVHSQPNPSGQRGERADRQPLIERSRGIALVVEGFISNAPALRQTLQASAPELVFDTESDFEVLLRGYQHEGAAFFSRLMGQFVAAIYDKSCRQLHLVRDPVGSKTLYYCRREGALYFASEIKPLLGLFEQTPELAPRAFLQFFDQSQLFAEQTPFEGLECLPPGQMLSVGHDLVPATSAYWQLKANAPEAELNEFLLRDRVDTLLGQVVKEQLVQGRSDFGIHLEPSLASMSLCALLDRYQSTRVSSFSLRLGAEAAAQTESIQAVAKFFRTEHHDIVIKPEQLRARLVHAVWAADTLCCDWRTSAFDLLSQQAAQRCSLMYSALGADEAFAAHAHYEAATLSRLFRRWQQPNWHGFRCEGLLNPRLAESLFKLASWHALEPMQEHLAEQWHDDRLSYCQRMQRFDLRQRLPALGFRLADHLGLANALAWRLPFADQRIMALGLSLPDSMKLGKKHQRQYLLSRWAKRYLPKAMPTIPTGSMQYAIGSWLDEKTRQELRLQLVTNRAIAEYFNLDQVRELLSVNKPSEQQLRLILSLTQFAIWHKLFVENGAKQAPSTHENLFDWL